MKCTCSPLSRAGGEQQAARGLAVASGAARLLVVGLERLGHGGVADGAHVGLVDPHAEGVGGDDDLDLIGHEGALGAVAGLAVEAGVVGGDADAERAPQRVRQLLGARARPGVDDRRAGRGVGQDGRDAPPAVNIVTRAYDHV